jgi:hypothetical protein
MGKLRAQGEGTFIMKFITAFVFFIASMATAQAQWGSLSAVSGKPLKLGTLGTALPDCSSPGIPTVRVVQAPQHGRVIVTKGKNFLAFAPRNYRHFHCNMRKIPSVSIQYISQRGYVGPDTMTLEAIFANGRYSQKTFSINVR